MFYYLSQSDINVSPIYGFLNMNSALLSALNVIYFTMPLTASTSSLLVLLSLRFHVLSTHTQNTRLLHEFTHAHTHQLIMRPIGAPVISHRMNTSLGESAQTVSSMSRTFCTGPRPSVAYSEGTGPHCVLSPLQLLIM